MWRYIDAKRVVVDVASIPLVIHQDRPILAATRERSLFAQSPQAVKDQEDGIVAMYPGLHEKSSVPLHMIVQSAYTAYAIRNTAESSSQNSKTRGTIIMKPIYAIAADTRAALRQF